jgi:hypothetical protein
MSKTVTAFEQSLSLVHRVAIRLALANHSDEITTSSTDRQSKVVKTPGKDEWCVESEKNSDWSGGCFESKGKAEDCLKQVEYFKHSK